MHLTNFDFIPDRFFKTQTHVPEWLLRKRWLYEVASVIIPHLGKKEIEYTDRIVKLMKQDIRKVLYWYLNEMNEAKISVATPLMMDFEIGTGMKPEIPYLRQIELTSEMALLSKGRLLPFINVDPRRKKAFDITVYALEKLGFLGVKFYPPLGYSIDPHSIYNISSQSKDNLEKLYAYCEQNQVPVTFHCSKNGAYSSEIVKYHEFGDYLSHPMHVERVLEKYPELKVNLAHFGGDLYALGKKKTWAEEILKMMKMYNNVFTDLACQTKSFNKQEQGVFVPAIRKILDIPEYEDKVIYGSDWPISGIGFTETEYAYHMMEVIGRKYRKVMYDNPIKFLFGETGEPPDRIKRFYRENKVKLTKI